MPNMRVAQISRPGGPFELVERPIPTPGRGQVRVKVEACGICHSDVVVKEGALPIAYPRVPGHEVAGVIDAVGEGAEPWAVGQRVGVGWNGGYDGVCAHCRRGDLFACVTQQVTGVTFDGGYAEYMLAPASALAALPPELTAFEAAPLMCAGITTFNSMRNAGARAGDLVAVLGVGGLGHLAVQFGAKMGFRTVAIARGGDKADLARSLGAHHYIDNQAEDPAVALQKLGGAKVVVATITEAGAMAATIGGLAPNGTLLTLGAAPGLQTDTFALIRGSRAIKGWYSGVASDSEDTLRFAVLTGVRSKNEIVPFEKVAEGYERMLSGRARFRVILSMTR